MFDHDRPISSAEQDALGRKDFSESIANAILDMDPEDSLVIGLIGSWGSGKTSIANLIQYYLKVNFSKRSSSRKAGKGEFSLLAVTFNPWNSMESTDIISLFFDELVGCLRSQQKGLGLSKDALDAIVSSIDEYISAMKPGVGKIAALLAYKRIRKRKTEGIAEKKKAIESALERGRVRILVVIDDLDRLSSERIREVFQLMAAIADFRYVSYLVAFDEEVVVNSLECLQGIPGERYLEKIVQVPIRVPDVAGAELRNQISRSFASVLDEYSSSRGAEPSDEMAQRQQLLIDTLKPHIASIRALRRIQNSCSFLLGALGDLVDPIDVLALEALRVLSPQGFCLVASNRGILCVEARSDLVISRVQDDANGIIQSQINDLLDEGPRELTNSILKLVFYDPREEAEGKSYRRANAYSHRRAFDAEVFERYMTAGISFHESLVDELLTIVSANNEPLASEWVAQHGRKGKFGEVLESAGGLFDGMNFEQRENICTALCANIEMAERVRATYSENTRVIDLVDRTIDAMCVNGRKGFVTRLYGCLDCLQVFYMAEFVIRQERAYQRNGFEGSSRKRLLDETTLQFVEERFLADALHVVESNDLGDFTDSFVPFALMKELDREKFAQTVFSLGQTLKRDLVLAEAFVGAWRNVFMLDVVTSFRLHRTALAYAGCADVSDLTTPSLTSRDIRSLPSLTQEKLVALHLFHELGPEVEEISIEQVRKRLEEMGGFAADNFIV